MIKYNNTARASYIYYTEIKDKQEFLDEYLVYSNNLKKLYDNKKRRNRANNNYKKRVYDSTNILTLDTENTSMYLNNGKPFAFSYVQMVCINKQIAILTRYIEELGSLLNDIQQWYKRHGLTTVKGFTSVIWVHNLSYDFQFLLNVCEIEETLSRKKRDVIYAIDANRCFMYKDSYSLLGVALDSATKDYNVEHKKLKGCLNYSLIRTPVTKLSNKEIAYCINDVIGLAEIIDILLNEEGYGVKKGKFLGYRNFSNTKTGLVRSYIADIIIDNKLQKQRDKLFHRINTSPEMYRLLRLSYQGGYTHAFGYLKGKILKHVKSFDKTSDYPYQMVTNKFPMGEFKETNINNFYEDYANDFEDHAYLIDFTISGDVRAKSWITTIPYHKFKKTIVDGKSDNGKLYKCKSVRITCTEMDFMDIYELYSFDRIQIHHVYRTTKDYLPYWILEAVFHFYEKKTTLKGVIGKNIEYQYFKQLLNSIYGCSVQDPCKEHFKFIDGKWESSLLEDDKDIKSALEDQNVFSYQWGVWVTAYARHELISVAKLINDRDLVYCDTDSLKFLDKPEYRKIFENLNKEITRKNKRVAKELNKLYNDIDYNRFVPVNQKGEIKELGLWDDEGTYEDFKTTGAKRYITTKYNKENKLEMTITCCGIAKSNMGRQLLKQSGVKVKELSEDSFEVNANRINKIFDLFDQDFSVEAAVDENGNSLTGKNIHTYYGYENPNRAIKARIKDYQNNVCIVKSMHYITLFPADFTFNANRDEIDFLKEDAV